MSMVKHDPVMRLIVLDQLRRNIMATQYDELELTTLDRLRAEVQYEIERVTNRDRSLDAVRREKGD